MQLLSVACLLVALAHASAFSRVPTVRAARPSVRTSAVSMRMGSGKGWGFGRPGRAGGNNNSPIRRGSSGDGAVGGGGGGDGTGSSSSGKSGDDSIKGPLGSIWAGYMTLLEERPILTKALTSLTGFAIGDLLVQFFIDDKGSFDWGRFVRFSSFGALIHGPTGHWFYGNLDALIPGATARKVATKVFIDQVLWNPIFGIMFFGYMAATEGKGPLAVAKRIQEELLVQVTGSWKVWPLAHAINFAFIPTNQRILYINSIQIGYNMFLSVIGNRGA